MKNLIKLVVLALISVLMFAGCGKQPTEEINNAKTAMESLTNEGAGTFVENTFKNLNRDFAAAMDEVKTQDDKFFKNYEEAKEMLVKVKSHADSLSTVVPKMKDAKTALDALVNERADIYAEAEFQKLNDDLASAINDMNTQGERSFEMVREKLVVVKSDADALMATILPRKEEAKNNAVTSLNEAKSAADEAKALLDKAPKGKGSSKIDSLKVSIKELEDSLLDTQDELDDGNYIGAAEMAIEIKDNAATLSAQVKQAIIQAKKKSQTNKK